MTENAVIPAPDAGALTLPNAITLAGAGLTAWWLRGGPAWAAVAAAAGDLIPEPVPVFLGCEVTMEETVLAVVAPAAVAITVA